MYLLVTGILKIKNMKQIKYYSLIFLFLIFSVYEFAQGITLGEASLSYVKAKTLQKSERVEYAVKSLSYLEAVGGVTFDQTATPYENLKISDLKLEYNSSMNDGKRFSVTINGKKAEANIYDWELIPIVQYANSNYTACFTLFGKLDNSFMENKIIRSGGKILNYHPSLVNTLLGLRLFQLDILIIGSTLSWDLPKMNGTYILGKGEVIPNILLNRIAYNNYQFTFKKYNQDFSSYLICDFNKDIRFNIQKGYLKITGDPFFYFWNYSKRQPLKLVDINGIESLSDYYKLIEESKMEHLYTLSDKISKQPNLLRNINPAVWDAGIKTMRYSAFFRYCKLNFPGNWSNFLFQIKNVKISPIVETPTVLTLNGNVN